MLPLDSPRWSELDTFFGKPENLPNVIGEWVASIGFDQEARNYNELYQLFLHQVTTTNAAYAVVPWMAEHLSRGQKEDQASYLSDIATVEFLRLTCGLHSLREGGEAEPTFVMTDYHDAIGRAQVMAEDILDEELHEEIRQALWRVMPALLGNATVAMQRMNRE